MGANTFIDDKTRDLLNTFDSLEKLLESENNSINTKNNTTMVKKDEQLVLKPKYNVGDFVKVISPNGEEKLLQINFVNVRVSETDTLIWYWNEYLTYDYEDYKENINICESKEEAGPNSWYIKCKCKVMEI